MKIQKKNLGGGGEGLGLGEGGRVGGGVVRVDVNEELKFWLGKFTKKKLGGGRGGGSG